MLSTRTPQALPRQLRGIFLEVSYPNEQPETQLFGHLTPRLLYPAQGQILRL